MVLWGEGAVMCSRLLSDINSVINESSKVLGTGPIVMSGGRQLEEHVDLTRMPIPY